MLTQRHRLKSRFYFKKTMDAGYKVVTPTAVVYAVAHQKNHPHRSKPRFGFVVSKKVSKKAVLRNWVKRRLREIVRQDILTLPDKQLEEVFCVVIIARQNALDLSYAVQKEMLLQAFQTIFAHKTFNVV